MKRNILGIAVALLTIALLASPVMAIGPQNAEKNPNAVFNLGWAMLVLPSCQLTEWVPSAQLGTTLFFQHKNADDFQIKKAQTMTINMASASDMMAFFANENQWIYLSQTSYHNFLFNSFALTLDPVLAGNIADYYASFYPDGLYIRVVIIGNP
jgi:hypothetical protein